MCELHRLRCGRNKVGTVFVYNTVGDSLFFFNTDSCTVCENFGSFHCLSLNFSLFEFRCPILRT